jgi:hypothetical protein
MRIQRAFQPFAKLLNPQWKYLRFELASDRGRRQPEAGDGGLSLPRARAGGRISIGIFWGREARKVLRVGVIRFGEARSAGLCFVRLVRTAFLVCCMGLAATACGSAPREVNHTIELSIEDRERQIAARFDFSCRKSDAEDDPAYLPAASSMLYVAPDGQALLLTSAQHRDSSFCVDERELGKSPDQALVPLLVWIDDIRSPGRLDEFGLSTVAAHRKFNFQELKSFSHQSAASALAGGQERGELHLLTQSYSALHAPVSSGKPRLVAPARRAARVKFATDAQRHAFRALLGRTIAPGVHQLDLCSLARTADGRDYLAREAADLIASCPRATAAHLPRQVIRFSMPLPMKLDGAQRWVTGGNDAVSTFLRNESSSFSVTQANPGRKTARSGAFWREQVRSVTWTTSDLRRVDLPVTAPTAYFFEAEGDIVLFLDDAEIIHLNNPLDWTRS